MQIPYWHIDAFAHGPFAGNQAAVMPLDRWLPDTVLQAIGEENNFAETAFVVPSQDQQDLAAPLWEIRWFTPTSEVALCGHATLAAGHVLLQQGEADRVRFQTRQSGLLEVGQTGDGYELALPATLVEPRENNQLLEPLGLGARGTTAANGADQQGKPAQIFESVSGAEQTAIILLEDEAQLRALEPDMRLLREVDMMVICTAPATADPASKYDVVSRVFVPAWGVDEDSVTGSAHAALGPFWAARLGRDEFTAHQASARGGDMTCRIDGNRVWLEGNCVTVVEGVFHLPAQMVT